MTRAPFGSTGAFSQTAGDYAATIAPALAPVAAEVVRRAVLRANERVLDIGTGTGTAAKLARGEGRTVTGLDGAPGMLEIAAREAPGIELIRADFNRIPLPDASIDAVLAVHSLLFAADRVAALVEWRRVAVPGARFSMSVPGPGTVAPSAIFGAIYDRYGIKWHPDDYPQPADLAGWAEQAGWIDVTVMADAMTAIPLADDAAFRAWLRVGRTSSDWDPERLDALAVELMAAAPRANDGSFRLPFGTIYLTARNR